MTSSPSLPDNKLLPTMVLCARKKCDEKGLFSVNKELGIIAKTIDPPLLFCKAHLLEMCDLYSMYKGIESMQGFLCLFSSHFWWTQIIQEDWRVWFISRLTKRSRIEFTVTRKVSREIERRNTKRRPSILYGTDAWVYYGLKWFFRKSRNKMEHRSQKKTSKKLLKENIHL